MSDIGQSAEDLQMRIMECEIRVAQSHISAKSHILAIKRAEENLKNLKAKTGHEEELNKANADLAALKKALSEVSA